MQNKFIKIKDSIMRNKYQQICRYLDKKGFTCDDAKLQNDILYLDFTSGKGLIIQYRFDVFEPFFEISYADKKLKDSEHYLLSSLQSVRLFIDLMLSNKDTHTLTQRELAEKMFAAETKYYTAKVRGD